MLKAPPPRKCFHTKDLKSCAETPKILLHLLFKQLLFV